MDTLDKGERKEREAEAEGKVNKDDNEDGREVQQAAKSVAVVVMAKKVSDNHLSRKEDGSSRLVVRQRPLSSRDPSPKPGHNETESGSDGDGEVQQATSSVAVVVIARELGDNHPSHKEDGSSRLVARQPLLPSRDPSPEPGHDKTGRGSYGNGNDKPSGKANPDPDNGKLRPAKQRRLSLSPDGSMRKKRKHHHQRRSARQRTSRAQSYPRSPESHPLCYQGLRATAVSSPVGRLPSTSPPALQAVDAPMPSDRWALAQLPSTSPPALRAIDAETPFDCCTPGGLPSTSPSTLRVMDAEVPSDRCNIGRWSRAVLPTLVEITFRPHSTLYCSFTAVVRDSGDGRGISSAQFARLVEDIGHIGIIDDFLVRRLDQYSFLLTGFSYIASRPSGMTVATVTETSSQESDGELAGTPDLVPGRDFSMTPQLQGQF
ncbi:MAG: hypothetical protein M1839_002107 [Geoglossum umbratile]|nr:MAG: hypothetical protein M1839_002107 [Geoglossum umbratile]